MSESSLQPEATVCDPALARAERRLAHLEELADLAMELARATQRRAMDIQQMAPGLQSGRQPARDAIADFDRAARIVRLTAGLQARLEEDLKTIHQEAEGRAKVRQQAEQAAAKAARTPLQVCKDDLRDFIGEAIDTETEGREARLLYAELDDRLDREDDETRLLNRPFGALIAEICTELGLEPDWSLWEEEDWAIEETRTDAQGSPYAAGPYRLEPPDRPAAAAPTREKAPAGRGP